MYDISIADMIVFEKVKVLLVDNLICRLILPTFRLDAPIETWLSLFFCLSSSPGLVYITRRLANLAYLCSAVSATRWAPNTVMNTWQWMLQYACAVEHANITTCSPHCAEYFGIRTMYCVWAALRVTVVPYKYSRTFTSSMWGSLRLAPIFVPMTPYRVTYIVLYCNGNFRPFKFRTELRIRKILMTKISRIMVYAEFLYGSFTHCACAIAME